MGQDNRLQTQERGRGYSPLHAPVAGSGELGQAASAAGSQLQQAPAGQRLDHSAMKNGTR